MSDGTGAATARATGGPYFREPDKGEVGRIHLPRTPVNIGYLGEVSRAPDYVQRVPGGTTTPLSSRYKLPSTITEFFVKGEAAEIEVDVGRTRQE
jgi:hypothetical protein